VLGVSLFVLPCDEVPRIDYLFELPLVTALDSSIVNTLEELPAYNYAYYVHGGSSYAGSWPRMSSTSCSWWYVLREYSSCTTGRVCRLLRSHSTSLSCLRLSCCLPPQTSSPRSSSSSGHSLRCSYSGSLQETRGGLPYPP